jgi:hypothetical protein
MMWRFLNAQCLAFLEKVIGRSPLKIIRLFPPRTWPEDREIRPLNAVNELPPGALKAIVSLVGGKGWLT